MPSADGVPTDRIGSSGGAVTHGATVGVDAAFVAPQPLTSRIAAIAPSASSIGSIGRAWPRLIDRYAFTITPPGVARRDRA